MVDGPEAALPHRPIRPPTLLDALAPVVVLIALLATTIVLFGVGATDGPLQVALLLAAAFASLVAFKNGHTVAAVADAAVGGVTSAIGAVFILLAVGALIGTWNMAGTIPTVVDYGIKLVNPAWFFFTTALVCAVVGMVTGSSWTTTGTLGVAFVIIGLRTRPETAAGTAAAEDALERSYRVSVICLLPLALLVYFAVRRYPPFLAILGSALFAGVLAPFTQPAAVRAFVDDPSLGTVATGVKAVFGAMATGFVSNTGAPKVDQLFSRGGMASMLTTVWLILGALSFAAIMEHAGFLQRLTAPVVARARHRGSLILAANASGVGLNVIAGDQYVADVLPSRMFRDEFARRGLAPQVLSRAVEDSGTVTSVLVPWNTCGAYISGVLGVPTAAYLPFCFFNILSPLLDIAYGFLGFKVPTADPEPVPAPSGGALGTAPAGGGDDDTEH
ncbi:Na+/H+ antiporter NhaC family protein [Catellatospora tritici]|uniref:Na+/H+ antiporter NhaC family protein n=1 Tax=Catellatospora tritici TaxID=2851566 RepID=UPI0020C5A505|nr:Na+/H+ antiporter NhaC family protein [Catellatospora tritici]